MSVLAWIGGGLAAIAERVQELEPRYALLALALQLATLALRALAWRGALAAAYPEKRLPVFSLGCAFAAGVALNAFLPARGGEGAKVLLARTQIPGSSVPAIAASLSVLVLLDTLLGVGLVAGLWAAGVLPGLPPLPSVPGGTPALAAAALFAATLGISALLARRVARALRGALEAAATGLAAFRSPRILFGTVVPLHLAAWAARVGVVHCVLLAFGVPAGLDTAVLVTVLSGLATAVPVPGGAGSQQLLASYALQGAISTAGAISFSMSMQLGITLVNTAVGLGATMLLFRTQRPLAALRALRER